MFHVLKKGCPPFSSQDVQILQSLQASFSSHIVHVYCLTNIPVCLRAAARAVQDVSRVADGDPDTPQTGRQRHSQLGQLLPSTLEKALLGSGQGMSATCSQ